MVHRPNVGIPHVSPHVVPKASLIGSPAIAADEEKTAVDSSWEDEQSTIDQAEMADKVRRALAEKRRAATGAVGNASNGNGYGAPAASNAAGSAGGNAAGNASMPTPLYGGPIPSAAIPTPLNLGGGHTTGSTGSTTGTTGGISLEEPTVEDRARPGLEAAALGLARLVVEVGPDAGKDFPLRAGKPVLVGRAIDNTVVLTDLSVSRKHLEINWNGTHWALADRGSGNGTLLNGKLEEGAFRLFNGDRIEIGHTTFLFEQQGQPGRNQWPDEEPSTLAGRRAGNSGSRPSELQTSEFGVPGPGESIVPLERKPLPLPRTSGIAAPFPSAPPAVAPAPSQPMPLPSFGGAQPSPASTLPLPGVLGSAPNLPLGNPGNGAGPGMNGLGGLGGLNGPGMNGLNAGPASARAVTAPRSGPMNSARLR